MDSLNALPQGSEIDMSAYLALAGRVKFALKRAVEIRTPIENIRPFIGQPREYFDPEKLKMLADSIAAGGQTTPGLIRRKVVGETEYELIDGERRWRAIAMIPPADRPEYEARLIEADDDVIQFILSGIANFNREGHTPIESMKTIDRLLSLGIPMPEISKLLGVSTGWAGQIHGLMNLAPEIQDKLKPELPRAQQISLVAAINISKLPSWPHQRLLAKQVMDGKLPLAGLRTEVIKTASKAGLHIRLRELAPNKQWESFCSKVGSESRTAVELKGMIQKHDLQDYLAGRPAEVRSLIRQLETTVRDLKWSEDRMKKCIGI